MRLRCIMTPFSSYVISLVLHKSLVCTTIVMTPGLHRATMLTRDTITDR